MKLNAIHFASAMKVTQMLGGVVVLVLITRYLDDVERGIYYSFTSIVSIQIFLELGVGNTFTQYISAFYEKFTRSDSENYARVEKSSSLIRSAMKWYLITFPILLIFIFTTGYIFFKQINFDSNWLYPWMLVSIGASLNYLYMGLSAICEGMLLIDQCHRIKAMYVVVQFISYSILLILNCSLYFVGIGLILSSVFGLVKLINVSKYELREVIRIKTGVNYSWFKEIFPFQWRMSLSLISGFFIFSMATPLFAKIKGPEFAGKVGFTLSILSSIQFLALNFIYVNVPLLGYSVEKKKYLYLNRLFKKNIQIAIVIGFTGLLLINLIVYMNGFIDYKVVNSFISKTLPIRYFLILSMITLLNIFSFSYATYVRAFRVEPFLWMSIFNASINCILFFVLSDYLSVLNIFIGQLLVAIFTLIYTNSVYLSFKRPN